jgi:hypothetical protein
VSGALGAHFGAFPEEERARAFRTKVERRTGKQAIAVAEAP